MSGFELTPEEIKLFLEESQEQLQQMEQCLISLEEHPDNSEMVQEIFRAAHTIKGGSATAGFENVAELTHAMESLLDIVRHKKSPMNSYIADRLLMGVDILRECFAAIENFGSAESVDVSRAVQLIGEATHESVKSPDHWEIIVKISPEALMPAVRAYQALLTIEDQVTVIDTTPSRTEIEQEAGDVRELTVHIGGGEPDDVFPGLKDMLMEIPDITSVEKSDPKAVAEAVTEAEAEVASTVSSNVFVGDLGQTIRVNVHILDELMNLVGELVIDRTRLAQLATADVNLQTLQEELGQLSGRLSRITTDLQENIMHARMMPIDTLFNRFPRMIRDISRQLGKAIDFSISGRETELDRSVIEQIGDPLMHLLRNAADHGIESIEERRRVGKSDSGRIGLNAYHQENHIHIEVVDDGRGIDIERLKARAIEKGIISKEEADRLSPADAAELIFSPGLTTTGSVSSLSGRGVGMDVVKRNIERVNGVVFVETEKGIGTKISIKLPLTLAILQALMVEIAGQTFAIPLSNVTEAVQILDSSVRRIKGWEIITVRNELTPLLNPGTVWGESWQVREVSGSAFPVVVLRWGGSPLGLKVDRLVGEEEIVIKTLGSVVGDVVGISGASILGDGRVALIVDPASLGQAIRQDLNEFGGEGMWP